MLDKKPRRTSDFWRNPKAIEAFLYLCKKSFEPSVNWRKFRKKDTKNIFGLYTNAQLSMRFRKFWLMEQGLCYYCGENKPADGRKICQECLDKAAQYANRKEPDAE